MRYQLQKNNRAINQQIYEKWLREPNSLTNVALYSLSTKLNLPTLLLVEEFRLSKA